MNTIFCPQQKSVLLISLPRGGSSWIGSILGAAENALYLREPITQPYMSKYSSCPSFFDMTACKDLRLYKSLSQNAFHGIAKFNGAIIPYPNQWRVLNRKARRVIIKEVNPLVISWLIKEFRPRIIYLLRHPASVAYSFHSLGWAGDEFSTRFSRNKLRELECEFHINCGACFWEQSGAIQAITQNIMMDALRDYDDYVMVRYEDICEAPVKHFRELMQFGQLKWDSRIETMIRNSIRANNATYSPGKYGINRDSKKMVNKWKHLIDQECLSKLRYGYFQNRPIFYLDEDDWQIPTNAVN